MSAGQMDFEPMQLKSYFSGTVEAAMELARKELGEEAMLVNARPSTPETRQLGAYEIVFGLPPREAPRSSALAASALPTSAPAAPGSERLAGDRLAGDIAALRQQLELLASRMGHIGGDPTRALPPRAAPPAATHPAPAEVDTDATLGRSGSRRSVVMLVGPPGAGKTTTLVKLAARYGLATRRRTQLISTDVYRIAAADQLRALAAILGIGCDVVETLGGLVQTLEEHHSKDLILIDTPGLSIAEIEDGLDLAGFAASHPEIDTHLVLPASLKAMDMARAVEAYAMFHPAKLIFTRVDETASHTEMLQEALRRGLPVSFLGTGQRIPDDIEPATRRRLLALAGSPADTAPAPAPKDMPRSWGASA